jgi:hypothetical protein
MASALPLLKVDPDQGSLGFPSPIAHVALPEPTASERSAISKATSRVRARRDRTQLESSPTRFDTRSLHPPHADYIGFTFQLRDTFGTTSKAFVQTQLKLIMRIVSSDNGTPDVDAVNAVIAMVDGLRPANELEAAAAVQIALTHHMSGDMLVRASGAMQVEHRERYLNIATKLQRTFVAQMEAFIRLRGRPEAAPQIGQVTVQDGGQAIVGTVNVGAGEGENGG